MKWIRWIGVWNSHHQIEVIHFSSFITMKSNFAVKLLDEEIGFRRRKQLHFLTRTFRRQPSRFITDNYLKLRTNIVAILSLEFVVDMLVDSDNFSQTLLEQNILAHRLKPHLL